MNVVVNSPLKMKLPSFARPWKLGKKMDKTEGDKHKRKQNKKEKYKNKKPHSPEITKENPLNRSAH
jgi:hypothetical protein